MQRVWVSVVLAAGALTAPAAAPAQEPRGARDFEGRWEAASEDGTALHAAEFSSADGRVTGRVVRAERGYFSGNVEVKEQLELVGEVRGGVLEFSGRLTDAEGGDMAASGTATRRGDYLILRVGTYEVALAPPGVPLATDAEGSPDAERLARLVLGREFSRTAQAHGGGAFVGERVRLALCSDGGVAYSRSDLVSTPGSQPGGGVDGGSGWSRRGRWSIVLYAGLPVVRAVWEGTGTTYSLVDYIRIEPGANGRTVIVDGTELGVTGGC